MYIGTGFEQPGLNSETTRQPGTKTPLSTNTRNQLILARNHNPRSSFRNKKDSPSLDGLKTGGLYGHTAYPVWARIKCIFPTPAWRFSGLNDEQAKMG